MHVIDADFSFLVGMAPSLIKAGSNDILDEYLKLKETPLFSVQYTTVGKLRAKQVAHVIVPILYPPPHS